MSSIQDDTQSQFSEQHSSQSSDIDSSSQDALDPQESRILKTPPRPYRVYTREELLRLSFSPLVTLPSNMPDLKIWFGSENENLLKKDEASQSSNARERRYRRDGEEDSSTRTQFRSTLSQPSQMGNFKHQSLRPNDREREKDREQAADRDKEGQERLRHLSDKYDRDRLALPLSAGRTRDRDTTALGSAAARNTQALSSNAASRRGDARENSKKKAGEASEDWRRGAEPLRTSRDDRHETTRKDKDDKDTARSKGRDSSKPRREPSTSRRDREKDKDDARDKRGDRDREDHRRNGDDEDRHWRDDGKRDERLTTRRGDRDRTRSTQDNWEVPSDRRWNQNEDKDGRNKRANGRDRKGNHPSDDKDKDERKEKERDKEKEPAWLEFDPTEASTGILGGQSTTGELDGIQVWKKGMKEKEMKHKDTSQSNDATGPSSSSTEQNSGLGMTSAGLDEIQMFKLMMKREEEKKRTEPSDPSSSDVVQIHGAGQVKSDVASSYRPGQSSLTGTGTTDPSVDSKDRVSHDSVPDRAISPPRSLPGATSLDSLSMLSTQVPDHAKSQTFQPPAGSRVLAFAKSTAKPVAHNQNASNFPPPGFDSLQTVQEIPRPSSNFSPHDEQSRQSHNLNDIRDTMSTHHPPPHSSQFSAANDVPYSNFAAPKGSRFAKFFDGKGREAPPPVAKQTPEPFLSPSPNQHLRADYGALANGPAEHRIEDLVAMLNNSQRGNPPHPTGNTPHPNNSPHFGNHNPSVLNYQQQLPPLQHPAGRFESLYESRTEDRFMPDGMVPGLRPIPPPRSRDTSGPINDIVDDTLHYPMQRLGQQPHRNIDPLYNTSIQSVYAQQGRQGGLPLGSLPQPHYRGAPSQGLDQSSLLPNGQQPQRLPPGLANLGGRPPVDPHQFVGLSMQNPASLNGLGNGPIQQQIQQQQPHGFNNYSIPNNAAFNGSQMRGPLPSLQSLQGPQQHPLNNLAQPNLDPRLAAHHQLMGLGGSRVNSGFTQHNQPIPAHLNIRPQQQQQNILPHMLPHLVPPHLQHHSQGNPNPQSNDLMAILMGGTHRE